jgi:CBS domain-containing protein
MKRDLEYVLPTDSAREAAQRMQSENVGFLPVCDDAHRVLGVVTDRDIAIRVVAADRSSAIPIREVMTREVVSCHPEDDLRLAEDLMAKHHKSRMMCVDAHNCLVGIISLSDIAKREEKGRASQVLKRVSEREARL